MRDPKRKTCTTWGTNVREIAEALGIATTPDQYVTIDNGDGGNLTTPMSGRVLINVWENIDA